MSIGTPIGLLTFSGANSAPSIGTGVAQTLTGSAAAASLVVVLGFTQNAVVLWLANSVADSGGNTYTRGVQGGVVAGNFFNPSIFFSSNITNALTSGVSTETITNGTLNTSWASYAVTGANGGQDVALATSGNAASLSLSTGTLANANEIIFSAIEFANAQGTYTEDSNFTQLSNDTGQGFFTAYQIVSSAASVTWAPSWANTVNYVAVLASFKITNIEWEKFMGHSALPMALLGLAYRNPIISRRWWK